MRVLIINYFYPPVVNAHAYRWEQIARYWVKQGHQVEVITSRVQGVANRSLDAGVKVTRVGAIARPIKYSSDIPTNVGRIEKLLLNLINTLRPLYRKLYWPDAWWHWAPSAMMEALARRHTKYDLIVSYYPCMGAHLAAALLKRWSAFSRATWIADYGDPFSTSTSMPPNNFQIFGRLNRLIERRIARLADNIVFTNPSTSETYTGAICYSNNVRVIPHLVDLKNLYGGSKNRGISPPLRNYPQRIINLLYIGGFHRGIREPDLLFDLIRQLNRGTENKYILKIFGPENGFNLSPDDCPEIVYGGMIEREKAIELMREAEVLINVENRNCVMTPSKVVEYIGTGRPLLNLKDAGVQHLALENYICHGHAISISRQELSSENLIVVRDFISKKAGSIAPLDDVKKILHGCIINDIADQYMPNNCKTKYPRP